MFPHIQAILAFDTPYLGISPGVVAYGAESHWNNAYSAYNTYNQFAGLFGWKSPSGVSTPQPVGPNRMLSAPDQGQTGSGGGWGQWALLAGAAGALAAGGAAAYANREKISAGVNWASSHLIFVGCLARGEELKKRLLAIAALCESRNFGFAQMYTVLGKGVEGKSKLAPDAKPRTFCTVPKSDIKRYWHPAVNHKATDEVRAHVSMFEPQENPGYPLLVEQAKEGIVEWTNGAWFHAEWVEPPSQGDVGKEGENTSNELGDDLRKGRKRKQQDRSGTSTPVRGKGKKEKRPDAHEDDKERSKRQGDASQEEGAVQEFREKTNGEAEADDTDAPNDDDIGEGVEMMRQGLQAQDEAREEESKKGEEAGKEAGKQNVGEAIKEPAK